MAGRVENWIPGANGIQFKVRGWFVRKTSLTSSFRSQKFNTIVSLSVSSLPRLFFPLALCTIFFFFHIDPAYILELWHMNVRLYSLTPVFLCTLFVQKGHLRKNDLSCVRRFAELRKVRSLFVKKNQRDFQVSLSSSLDSSVSMLRSICARRAFYCGTRKRAWNFATATGDRRRVRN